MSWPLPCWNSLQMYEAGFIVLVRDFLWDILSFVMSDKSIDYLFQSLYFVIKPVYKKAEKYMLE